MNDMEALRTAVRELRADVDRLLRLRVEDEAEAEAAMLRLRQITGQPSEGVIEAIDKAGL